MSGLRPVLRFAHRWVALLAGAYLLVISLTGAALLFRIDLQKTLDPGLFPPATQAPLADPLAVFTKLSEVYPEGRITGMETPTNRRPSTLAYVVRDKRFITVLLDPATGQVLGELPQRPVISLLHAVHFDLTLGRSGRVINGIGALVLTALGLTGLFLWWRGRQWRQGLIVRSGQNAATTQRELHAATGFWTSLLLLMWGVTGVSFIFPAPFTNAIGWFSPVKSAKPPTVQVPPAGAAQAALREQLAAATTQRPGRPIARIVLPAQPRAALQVLFAKHSPTQIGEQLEILYVDPWRATIIGRTGELTAGETIWGWFSTLHTAAFGGYGVRLLWLLFALAPALLLVTGLATWGLRLLRAGHSNG